MPGEISDFKNKALTWVRKKKKIYIYIYIYILFGGVVKYREFKKIYIIKF